jgi:hypothetical protein
VLLLAFAPTAIPGPLREYVLAPALEVWYLGVAVLVAAILLRRSTAWRGLSRVLGVLGVAWVAFFVGFYVALILVFTIFPIGY